MKITHRKHDLSNLAKSNGAISKNPTSRIDILEGRQYLQQQENVQDSKLSASYDSVRTQPEVHDLKVRIELQRIEEERMLVEQRQEQRYRLDQEYLHRKYEILLRGSQLAASTEQYAKKFTISNGNQPDEQMQKGDIDFEEFSRRLDALKLSTVVSENNIDTRSPFNRADVSLNGSAATFHRQIDIPNARHNQRKLNSNAGGSGRSLTKDQIAARHVVTKDLAIYTGKPEDWPIFYKRFVNSTELCGYSNGENLDRLQKCLKGSAYDAVRDLLLDADSVPDIIDTLEMLFGRSELIIKSLLKQIHELQNPRADNLNSIVKFALEVRNLAKTVERKEMKQYLTNPILLQELVDRLPNTYKVDWARHIANVPDKWLTLVTLSDWLYGLMKAIIKVTDFAPRDSDKKFEKKQFKSNSERVNVHQEEKNQLMNQMVKTSS